MGPVELAGQELRVVGRVETCERDEQMVRTFRSPVLTLIPERRPDLKHPVEPADHHPLQPQLRRDAQAQLALGELGSCGAEGLRDGAAGSISKNRRLHFGLAIVEQELPYALDDSGLELQELGRVRVDVEVDVAVAHSRFGVLKVRWHGVQAGGEQSRQFGKEKGELPRGAPVRRSL